MLKYNSLPESSETDPIENEQAPFLQSEVLEVSAKSLVHSTRDGATSRRSSGCVVSIFVGILTCFCITLAICAAFEAIHRMVTTATSSVQLGSDVTGFIPECMYFLSNKAILCRLADLMMQSHWKLVCSGMTQIMDLEGITSKI